MRRKIPGQRLLAALLTASFLAGGGAGRILAEEASGALVDMIQESEEKTRMPEEESTMEGEPQGNPLGEEAGQMEEEGPVGEEGPSGLPEEEVLPEEPVAVEALAETAEVETVVQPEEILVEDVPMEAEDILEEDPDALEELPTDGDEEPYQVIFEDNEEVAETDLLLAATDYPDMEGSPVAGSGTEYTLVTSGSEVYKGNYNLLGDTNNAKNFVYTPFNNAGDHVIYWEHSSGACYFVPKDASAAGKYGFLVENVGFNCEENCMLDMRLTVTDFRDYALDRNGNKVEGIYPSFGLRKGGGLSIAFGGADQNVRVEILRHGTNTLVQGDYSFRWLDIDAGQRFGMHLVDGQLSGRYALNTCTAYYQNDLSRFNRTYQMVNAKQDVSYISWVDGWMDGTVYWEVKGCSQMDLLIATAGNSDRGRYWEHTIRSKYNNSLTNTFPDDKVDLGELAWDGESYGPKENPMAIQKYVSNDLETPETVVGKLENTLPAAESPFYYYLSNHVPVESPAYYYNLYTVTDTLPAGTVYLGGASVTKAETGEDVTGWFDIQAQNGTVTFGAVNMESSLFYGSTYLFKIPVGLDKGALTPVYSGHECVYSVRNQATVSSRHKTDGEAKTASSNEVTTILRELGKGSLLIRKTSPEDAGLEGAVYEVRVRDNILSPSGALLAEAGTVVGQVTTGPDGNALLGDLYAGSYVVTEVLPPRGYSLNGGPQEVLVQGPGMGADPSTAVFRNERTLVYLRKVSSLAPGETEKRVIPGVEFRIWNKETAAEEQADIYVTDEAGTIRLEGFVPGTYCWREAAPAPGYASNTAVGEFVIDERGLVEQQNGYEIQVENTCLTVDFIKTDRVTGEAVAGATLCLTDEEGNEVETWISENVPHRISRIPVGTYTLTELEAPENYKKAEPITCVVTDTPQVQTYQISNVKYVDVELTKTILAKEVVWAHGNPTFTLCLQGSDLDGETYTYRKTLVFAPEIFGEQKEGVMSLKADFHVPAGDYQAWEGQTARYRLKEITSLENGSVQGGKVFFALSENQDGKAELINEKVTDEYLTHTDFVKNVIIE